MAEAKHTPRTADSGPYAGNAIRQARKLYACDQMVSWAPFARCNNPINPRDRYVEGDACPDRAGGFARDRICLSCAAIAKAEGQ